MSTPVHPVRSLRLEANERMILCAGLCYARLAWMTKAHVAEPGQVAEARRIERSVELAPVAENTLEFRVTSDSCECLNAVADVCRASKDSFVQDLADTIASIAERCDETFAS